MMMLRRMSWSLILAALLVAGTHGQQPNQSDRIYQAALHKEMVQRDPKGAIEDYRRVARGRDKLLAAKALFRMAECFQKLGDAEATKIYEQLVRDYSGLPEAAEARNRLAASIADATDGTVQRKVGTTPSRMHQAGGISTDGRWLLYTYNSGPNTEAGKWGLYIRDLVSGTTRRLVASTFLVNREQVDYRSAISRDNRMVAYQWQVGPGKAQLRTVSVHAPAEPPKVLVDSDDIRYIAAHDWTPDRKLIAVDLVRNDKTAQIALVSATDGSIRVLKSVNWDQTGAIRFSPDGKYIAVGERNPADGAPDIHVMAIDASRGVPAVVYQGTDSLLGWSPNGKELLFLSDRSGSTGIWSQEFTDRPVGDARLIRADTGHLDGIGITDRGDLYYASAPRAFASNIKIASLDLSAGRVLSRPVVAVHEHVGSNDPARWSHDGTQWAYISHRGAAAEVLVIRSTSDNRIARELPLRLDTDLNTLEWSRDDRSLTVLGGLDGRRGVYRVDAQTGQATPIVVARSGWSIGRNHHWSADGKKLYFLQLGTLEGSVPPQSTTNRRTFTLVALDVASNTETEIMRATHEGITQGTNFVVSRDDKTVYFTRRANGTDLLYGIVARDIASGVERTLWEGVARDGDLNLSPDGRFLIRSAALPSSHQSSGHQWLIPTDGGKPRALTALKGGVTLWSADSRSVLFSEADPSNAFWVVPVDGSSPINLGTDFTRTSTDFRFHPDGRLVLFLHNQRTGADTSPTADVWVIERLVPASSPARK